MKVIKYYYIFNINKNINLHLLLMNKSIYNFNKYMTFKFIFYICFFYYKLTHQLIIL